MQPIRDISTIGVSSVLYHSAFGFARVSAVEPNRVALEWQQSASNLPTRVSHEVLLRVYAFCPPDGFFHRAVHDTDPLKDLLQAQALDGLVLLLNELHGPQSLKEVREWMLGLHLMSEEGFEHWWRRVQPVVSEDERFEFDNNRLSLRSSTPSDGPQSRLDNPLLPPGRRLDLILQHRGSFDDAFFVRQVLLAWRTGSTQVRDLALAAMRGRPPEVVLEGLLQDGPDCIDALIHAIRRGNWQAVDVDVSVHKLLVERVMVGIETGGPVDNEGRLCAALIRWQAPHVVDALQQIVATGDGKRLIRATFASLPPRRGEQVALDLLEQVLLTDDSDTAQWVGGEALGFSLIDHEEMSDRLEEERPALAEWFHSAFRPADTRGSMEEWLDDSTDDSIHTAEIDLSDLVNAPLPLADLPPRSGASLLGMGLAMARALAQHHKDEVVVNPTARTVRVLPNETMEATPTTDDPSCPRPLMETPSLAADIYAAGVLLVESMLGRTWPRNVAASKAVPYLRTVIPLLPPSALAPLDAALHPFADQRPADALAWLALWQAAAVAEESRLYAPHSSTCRLHTGFDSHIGRMKVLLTQTNQDSIFVSTKGPISLLVICDGISTANAGSGDVASSIASHVIANLWEQALPRLSQSGSGEIREFLDRALRMANTAVCEAALRFAGGDLDGRVPMGTTAVVGLVHGNHVSLAWLGDSRAYLVGPYGASLLTSDENQAGERMKAWHLKFLDAWDPAGFALVGYLGHFDEMSRPEALPAHHTSFTLLDGERLMMCTDGITDYIGETHPEVSQLVAVCCREEDPDEAARSLVSLANRGGGGDNATVLVGYLWNP